MAHNYHHKGSHEPLFFLEFIKVQGRTVQGAMSGTVLVYELIQYRVTAPSIDMIGFEICVILRVFMGLKNITMSF